MNFFNIALLISFFSFISSLENATIFLKQWESFKMTHKKAYKSHEEENLRMKIFATNLAEIAKHNFLYAIGQKSYTMKMNKFGDMLKEEIVQKLNGFRGSNRDDTYRNAVPFLKYGASNRLPESVDWREKGAVTNVKDQADCGSCWAFSTTGSIEGQHFLKTNKLVPLSEQFLVDCSSRNGGCSGGFMNQAFEDIMMMSGIQSEETYPYLGYNDLCHYNKSLIAAKIQDYVTIESGDEEALQEAVAFVGPISVAIDAGESSFLYYNYGIYDESDCSSQYLNHAVLAVGYGKTSSGTEYWIVKNSWGYDWGDGGYIRILKNKNMCGIATLASYPRV